jgi:hypothetical protein
MSGAPPGAPAMDQAICRYPRGKAVLAGDGVATF